MKANKAAGEFLLQKGWTPKGSCNCGGVNTDKYSLLTVQGEYNIKIRGTNFLLSKPGEKFFRHPITKLKDIVNEIEARYKTIVPSEAKI